MLSMRAGLVSLLLVPVVACGDDDPAGPGGAGGAGTGPAATSTGSGTTASGVTTSSSSGDGGAGGGIPTGAGGAGGGGGGSNPACDDLAGDAPRITVVTVDETGAPVDVQRVLHQDQPADPFWLSAQEATCASGAEPPCSVWSIDGELGERIAITSERTTEAAATESCMPYASTFVQVHLPEGGATRPQLVHLTLPSDGTYCIGEDFSSEVNHAHDEEVDASDCLVAPPVAEGPIVLGVVDQDGEPVPASIAHWYYHPEGPDHDGEHPLACADQRCETWVVRETPQAGTMFLNASYAGPLNPFVQTGWSGYDGAPFQVEVDDAGAIVPISAVLVLDTTLEGAIGG